MESWHELSVYNTKRPNDEHNNFGTCKPAEFKAKHKGMYFSLLLIARVNEMIKWVGNFDYKSFAIYIINNNTYVWFATPYLRTVEPVKINTLEHLTILCDDGFI